MSKYPPEWNLVPIRELIFESRINPEFDDPSKRISVRLHCEGVEKRSERATDQAGATKYYKRLAGQFIYGKQNLYKGALGIVPKELDGFCSSQDIPTFDISSSVDPIWFLQLFKQRNFYESLERIATGTGSKRIQPSALGEINIGIPPLPEQKKIAKILSEIEKLKQCCIDEIKKIDLVEKSLWSQLFLEEENDEWRKIIVSDIGTVIRGASPRPKGDPRYYGGNVPRLMVADVTRDGKKVIPKIDFLTEEGAKLSRPVPAGTLTIVCSGVVGVPSILSVPACIHDGFLAIKDISKSCLTEYLYYYFKPLQSRLDSSATHGGIFTNLTTEILKNFPVMLPSLRKQKEICEILNTIDCHRDLLLKKKEKIQFLFNSVSSELLSGRKKVSV